MAHTKSAKGFGQIRLETCIDTPITEEGFTGLGIGAPWLD
jgi:pyruvate/2-oxoglutarate/acetoin dehydrogenase E1 component